MIKRRQPFSRFALNKSAEHAGDFGRSKLDINLPGIYDMAEISLAEQKEIESKEQSLR